MVQFLFWFTIKYLYYTYPGYNELFKGIFLVLKCHNVSNFELYDSMLIFTKLKYNIDSRLSR